MPDPNASRYPATYPRPSSFEDVVDWLNASVGVRLNVLLSSLDGSVLAFLRGTLSDVEELQGPPAGPRRVAFGVGPEGDYFVLDEGAFGRVERVGMMSLVLITSTVRASLEVESLDTAFLPA